MADSQPDTFRIELTQDELVVLDDLLERLSQRRDFASIFPEKGDRVALWNLHCLVEELNPLAFSNEYVEQLAEARSRLTGNNG
jgi:hypothetical protein